MKKSLGSIKKGEPVKSSSAVQRTGEAVRRGGCCALVNTDISKVESAAILWQVLLLCINTGCPMRKDIEDRAAKLGMQRGAVLVSAPIPF